MNEYYRSADPGGEMRQVVMANRDRGNRFFAVAHLMETHSPLFEWDGEATTGESLGPIWSETETTSMETFCVPFTRMRYMRSIENLADFWIG